MDQHEKHHQHHEKEREHEKQEKKRHEHEEEQKPRVIHPGWFLAVGIVLIILVVLVWTYIV